MADDVLVPDAAPAPAGVAQPLAVIENIDRIGLPEDDLQELKEAVCDALVERTRRSVCGEGDFGAVVYGDKPSRMLSSGFLLPSYKANGDPAVSSISIATHGMDVRIQGNGAGMIRVQPVFNVYVRILPEADEVFAERLGLRPRPRISPSHLSDIRERVRERCRAEICAGTERAEYVRQRAAILADEYRRCGIQVGAEEARFEAEPAEEGGGETPEAPAQGEAPGDGEEAGERRQGTASGEFSEDVRIPDAIGVHVEVPEVYLRLPVDTEILDLPLPYDREVWVARVRDYNATMAQRIRTAYESWMVSEEGQRRAWRNVTVPPSAFWMPENWEAFLVQVRQTPPQLRHLLPGAQSQMVAEALPSGDAPDELSLRLAVECLIEGDYTRENGLFQVMVRARFPDDVLRPMRLHRVSPSYHLSGFLNLPGMGLNGGVKTVPCAEGVELETTWAPRFVLPRIRPTSYDDVPVDFASLSDPAEAVSRLRALPGAMEAWIGDVDADITAHGLFEAGETYTAAEQAREQQRYEADVRAWTEECERVTLGIRLLEVSQEAYRQDPRSRRAMPYVAWLLMNETFATSAHPGWRLFQLAFILAHVPTLASRMPEFEDYFRADYDEDKATLLYMSTGGGKSEAFFGVLLFNLFLDRLRGKKRGVTAMLHYPLRLLTLQQSQRLFRLLAQGELVRRRRMSDHDLAGAAFEIGFWVGSNNTPNAVTFGDFRANLASDLEGMPTWEDPSHGDEDALKAANPSYRAMNASWNKIPQCPFCRSETVLRIIPEYDRQLAILCSNHSGSCGWNAAHAGQAHPEPLPFLLVDRDIYRRAPSVLLGTIDKMALLGNNPSTISRIAGMFGMATHWKPETGLLYTATDDQGARLLQDNGCAPLAPWDAAGPDLFVDPFPSIVVQDEMHLLEESLGTFGGLFFTTLTTWFHALAEIQPARVVMRPLTNVARMPKNVAATATISDPERQVHALYQKGVVQFPHPGPQTYRSFYSAPLPFRSPGAQAARPVGNHLPVRVEEANAPWARLYVSLLTNGRPHTATSVSVMSAFAIHVTFFLRSLCALDDGARRRAVDDLIASISDTPHRQRHIAVLERYRDLARFDVIAHLVDLHRLSLTYVTNKKGGDQIMSALRSQTSKEHRRAMPDDALRIADFRMQLISGGVDVRSIQQSIEEAGRVLNVASEDVEDTLRCIVATSAISHGVDVDNFNSMFFAGMPSDIAEYIQASSRIGRTHVGFSMLLPTPQTRRDRFIVESHETFHRLLERMIAPPAIERWAERAVERVIPSLFQTFFAGVLYYRDRIAGRRTQFPATVPALLFFLAGAREGETLAACRNFVGRAVGIPALGDDQRDYMRSLVAREINAIISELQQPGHHDLRAFWGAGVHNLHRPMTSLRDVDEVGEISAFYGRRPGNGTAQAFRRAMGFLRTGVMVTGRDADSELDGEGA